MSGGIRRTLLRATGLGTVGLGLYGSYRYRTEEGFERSVRLWSQLGPTVAHYRLVELKQKLLPPATPEAGLAEYEALHELHCKKAVEALRQLQGMYVKYGQIGAGLTDTFPKVWIDELRSLEDRVPPQPKEVVFRTIREDFGRPAEEIFSEFDDVPLGSASIGQVHRAVLRSTGQEVAVKVQYPHSLRLFTGDMNTIRSFMEVAAPEQVITLTELESMFAEEFDYAREANNLQQVHDNLSRSGHVPTLAAVPLPVPGLSTKRVLVMDLLRGRKLVDGLREFAAVVAAERGQTLEQFEKAMQDKIEREGLPPVYEGPSRMQLASYQKYLRAYDAAYNAAAWTYNGLAWTYNGLLGRWLGPGLTAPTAAYSSSKIPVNTPQLVEDLMSIHAQQLFRDGCFNADPHAGNFLLLQDSRIGLIDFGATKRLTRGERLSACAIFVALARRDAEMIKAIAVAGGYKSKHMKMQNIFKLVEFGFDSFGKDVTGGKNVQQFTDDLYRDDPWTESAGNLTMAQFLSIRLRSMFMQMGHPVRCSHYWGAVAERVLEEEGCPYRVWDEAFAREIMKDDLRIVKG